MQKCKIDKYSKAQVMAGIINRLTKVVVNIINYIYSDHFNRSDYNQMISSATASIKCVMIVLVLNWKKKKKKKHVIFLHSECDQIIICNIC